MASHADLPPPSAPSPGSAERPLSVLVLATTFPARAGDGTPEFVLTLSSALAAHGAQVTAIVPRVPRGARQELIDGVRVQRFAYFPRRFEGLANGAIMPNLRAHRWRWLEAGPLAIAFMLATARQVRRERPDVIHAHWIVPAGLVAWVLRRTTGVPYVVTAHGADAYTLRGGATRRLKRAVLRRASATIPVSAAIGEQLRQIGPVSPAIPMGIDVARIATEVGQRRPEPGRVLFVGRLADKKGVDILIQAAARVRPVSVVVIGDGPTRAGLEALANRIGMTDRVRFLGALPRQGVMDEFARAAAAAIPSRVAADGDQDGVPVVLGEAMAAGVPVVATDLGGLGEYVSDGENARVVAPGSVDELAAALDDLVKHPDAAEALARCASARLADTLDLGHISAQYFRVLLDAADAGPGRAYGSDRVSRGPEQP
ncbi:MAG: glycosyltransferase [Actinomycetia bacterium]|nr:glycosyltransferase [Actinomycetes bacterium]